VGITSSSQLTLTRSLTWIKVLFVLLVCGGSSTDMVLDLPNNMQFEVPIVRVFPPESSTDANDHMLVFSGQELVMGMCGFIHMINILTGT
jgi:hypothetical protein